MAINGAIVDWAVFWQIIGWTGITCAVVLIALYLLRKRISRVTFRLWYRPLVSWHAWSASHASRRERDRARRR